MSRLAEALGENGRIPLRALVAFDPGLASAYNQRSRGMVLMVSRPPAPCPLRPIKRALDPSPLTRTPRESRLSIPGPPGPVEPGKTGPATRQDCPGGVR